LVYGLYLQHKQLQTSPAAARSHREVRTIEKIAREHTTVPYS